MRLARPRLSTKQVMGSDPVDPSGIAQAIDHGLEAFSGENRAEAPVSGFLVAPQMFENIYLGETFSFYVNCVNESDQKVHDVCVKCEIQTSSQRVSLSCSVTDYVLGPSETAGEIVHHEVKELGQHILICSVNYKTRGDEKMFFRKFFKFPVEKPIDVKTKFYNAENSDVFLEAQIENTSKTWMVLDKVDLEPSAAYKSVAIKPGDGSGVCSSVLRPGDIRQFLFGLTPSDPHHFNDYRNSANIGKLDLAWRTAMGERGRLQTSSLQRIAPGYGDVRLEVVAMPATAVVRQPFEVLCKLHNCSERVLDLVVQLKAPQECGLVFCCPSGVSMGQIPPNTSLPLTVHLLPTTIGLQIISGINVVDGLTKRSYEPGDIAQVFVTAM